MYYVSKSILLTGTRASFGSLYLRGADPHTSDVRPSLTPSNTTTGWVVGKTASGSYCSVTSSTTVAAANFTTNFAPNGGLSTTVGEGWVCGPYTGVFLRNTMSLQWQLIATTVNAQQGKIFFRFWKGTNKTGAGASIMFPVTGSTNAVAVIAGGSSRISASYIMPNSVTMNNEYMFIESAWGITTAAGSNAANVLIRQGSGSFLRTGPFEDNTFFIVGDDLPGYA